MHFYGRPDDPFRNLVYVHRSFPFGPEHSLLRTLSARRKKKNGRSGFRNNPKSLRVPLRDLRDLGGESLRHVTTQEITEISRSTSVTDVVPSVSVARAASRREIIPSSMARARIDDAYAFAFINLRIVSLTGRTS